MIGSPPGAMPEGPGDPTIDREVRPHATSAHHQHALTADGLDQHLSSEQMPGADRESDPSDRLRANDPVPPLRHLRLATQLGQERHRRPGHRLPGCRNGVFKWGR